MFTKVQWEVVIACAIIVIIVGGWWWMEARVPAPRQGATAASSQSASGTQNAASSSSASAPSDAIPTNNLLTKSEGFTDLIKPLPTEDALLAAYSQPYIQEQRQVQEATASIQDSDLRQQQAVAMWRTFNAAHNRSQLEKEAQSTAEAAVVQAMSRMINLHSSDWFEVSHVSFSTDLGEPGMDEFILSDDVSPASPIQMTGTVSHDVPLPSVDALYSRFNALVELQAKAATDQYLASDNLRMCRDLPGCDPPSYQEAYKQRIASMRKERIILAAKGDMLTHRIDSVAVLDYDTGQILLDLSDAKDSVLPQKSYKWKVTPPFGLAHEAAPPETPSTD